MDLDDLIYLINIIDYRKWKYVSAEANWGIQYSRYSKFFRKETDEWKYAKKLDLKQYT